MQHVCLFQVENLSDIDKARLESCIEGIRATLGDSVSRQQLVSAVLSHNFNTERALNYLLEAIGNRQENVLENREKGDYFMKLLYFNLSLFVFFLCSAFYLDILEGKVLIEHSQLRLSLLYPKLILPKKMQITIAI